MRQVIYTIVYLPIVLSYLFKGKKDKLVVEDIEQARKFCAFYVTPHRFTSFLNFIVHYPEWRQVYSYRIGGFFTQHAYSTIVLAQSVGRNFQVWQNATIGKKQSGGGIPTISDNVKICTGA